MRWAKEETNIEILLTHLKKLGIATSSEGDKRILLELLILKRGKESNIIIIIVIIITNTISLLI